MEIIGTICKIKNVKYIPILVFSCLLNSAIGQTRVVMMGAPGNPSKDGLRGPTGCVLTSISLPQKDEIERDKRMRVEFKKTYGYWPNGISPRKMRRLERRRDKHHRRKDPRWVASHH